jgi:hypothetical protein
MHLIIFILLSFSPEPTLKLLKSLIISASMPGGRGEDERRQNKD